MCLDDIRESKEKPKFGYKIFNVNEKSKLCSYIAEQPFKESTEVWQSARWKTEQSVQKYSAKIPGYNMLCIAYHESHLNKISVFLKKRNAKSKLDTLCFGYRNQIWKVELKYKKLLVGDFDGDCALVDQIRLVEKIK